MIHIVGLGPGDPSVLPPRAFDLLTSGLVVLVRTERHPTLDSGPLSEFRKTAPRGRFIPLDDEYEHGMSFADTYSAIVERVLRTHQAHGDCVYAVPGHPLVGESTVALLLERSRDAGIPTRVVGAASFVDACLEAVGFAVTGDLRVLDAHLLSEPGPATRTALAGNGPLLLYQVHDRAVASAVKLALMDAGWPDDFPVQWIRGAGIPGIEDVRTVPLYTLDRLDSDHLTSVWVDDLPADLRPDSFETLLGIMARLRDPDGGCPWDREQTHASLRKYVLEEAYEVVDAIDADDPDGLCEELGDLLLQVVFHAQLGAEEGLFDARDVCRSICRKLVRRHPHVFGDTVADDSETVLRNWNAIKAQEKSDAGKLAPANGALYGLNRASPSLALALDVSKRVVRVGFEWADTAAVLAKAEEEFAELRAEVNTGAGPERIADELGDVLFTLVNVGRKSGIDPELALRRQVDRFASRWNHVETAAANDNVDPATWTPDQLRRYWNQAKAAERERSESDV